MAKQLLNVEIRGEHDVVLTRQRARQIAGLLGFDAQDQTRVSTAVSEIARNAFAYAGRGTVTFAVQHGSPDELVITVRDGGPGIDDVRGILDGRRITPTGRGTGIIGAKRLVDGLEITSAKDRGTVVELRQRFPLGSPPLTEKGIAAVVEGLTQRGPQNPMEEMRQQNQELMRTLQVLQQRQSEVERLNRELEETNRGVLALYSELDEKAQALKRASELKSRFLSNMTHELRTPLNSVLMVTQLLIDGTQGPLAPEQLRPLQMVNRSAGSLLELVNDLLDLAKIEAGKIEVKASRFSVAELFGGLRGVFRPLIGQGSVELTFTEASDLPVLLTDEGKVAQILRNFLSNALKFTQRGSVRVTAEEVPAGVVRFSVSDTGIGIAHEDQERIFEEFTQVGSGELKAKGTGLGLSLSRRLAELLGGGVAVRSTPGAGSVFIASIPVEYSVPGPGVKRGDHERPEAIPHPEVQNA
jgi:signal transduction histidine kinase